MNIEILVTIVATVFASSGFWQFLMMKREKKDEKTKALLALLHNEIYNSAEKAILRGNITTEELDNLTCLFEPYEKLGGNGTGLILYTKAKNLPQIESKGE